MSKTLLYFPANWPLNAARRAYLEEAGYAPEPYSQARLKDAELLLLATPVKDGEGNWISPEWVWKKYIEKEYPNLKPIQAGWHGHVESKNYLDWFDLPPNFGAFVEAADAPRDWKPFDTMAERLETVWAKFYEGHGKNGFQDWFLVVNRKIPHYLQALEENQRTFEDILDLLEDEDTLEAFENIQKRWERYLLIFVADPRQQEIKEMGTQVQRLAVGWNDCKEPAALLHRLREFAHALEHLKLWKKKLYDTALK